MGAGKATLIPPEEYSVMEGRSCDRRQHLRLPVRMPGSTGPRLAHAYRIVDVSRSGCSVETRRPLGRVASYTCVPLPLSNRPPSRSVRARIVWEERGSSPEGRAWYRYGLCFQALDPATSKGLDLYLDFLWRDLHISQLDAAWRRIAGPAARGRREDGEGGPGQGPVLNS